MTKNKKAITAKKNAKKTGPAKATAKKAAPKQKTASQQETQHSVEFRKIPIELIDIDPRNPRKTIDDAEIDELAESIKATGGLLQPVAARQNGERWTLIFGQRRVLASRRNGYTTIDALIHDVSDEEALSMAIMENLQRVNVDPVEEADSLAELQRLGHDIREIAMRLGKGPHWTAARLKLAKMSDDIKSMVSRGEITLKHIEAIAKIDDPATRRKLAMDSRHRSVGEIETMIKRMTRAVGTAPFPPTLTVKSTSGTCGPCENCLKRSDKQNDLFGPSEKAICTDPSCWESLLEAHRIRMIAKLKKQGIKVLSEEDYNDASSEWNGWTATEPEADAKFTAYHYVTDECATEIYYKLAKEGKASEETVEGSGKPKGQQQQSHKNGPSIGGIEIDYHTKIITRKHIAAFLSENVDQIGFGKSLAITLLSIYSPEDIGEAYQSESEVLDANIAPIDLLKIGLRLSNVEDETFISILSTIQSAPSIQEFIDKARKEEA